MLWLACWWLIFGSVLGEQYYGKPSSSLTQQTSDGTGSSSTSVQFSTIISDDPMTVTETVFNYLTTSSRITRTIELTVTLTELSTKILTKQITSTALSITQATVTSREKATIVLSTTLTRVSFIESTDLRPTTRITTVTTDTSTTTVAIVSLRRSTTTTFFQSSYSVEGTFTTLIQVLNTNTLVILEPEVSVTSVTDRLTVYTATAVFFISTITTEYLTTITDTVNTRVTEYGQTVTNGFVTIGPTTSISLTVFTIKTFGKYSTAATVQIPVPISYEYTLYTTLIR